MYILLSALMAPEQVQILFCRHTNEHKASWDIERKVAEVCGRTRCYTTAWPPTGSHPTGHSLMAVVWDVFLTPAATHGTALRTDTPAASQGTAFLKY